MRILIVRIDGIGDNIMNTAFVREFYKCYKSENNTIDLLIRPYVYPVIKNIPWVDNIKFLWGEHLRTEKLHVIKLTDIFLEYDWVVCPRWGSDLGIVKALVGVNKSVRVSGFKTMAHESNIDPYSILTDCVECNDSIHEVERSVRLLSYFGHNVSDLSIDCFMDDPHKLIVDSVVSEFDKEFVCISIAASYGKKRWSILNYKELICYIQTELNMDVLIVGGSDVKQYGRDLIRSLDDQNRVINTTGRIDISDTYALMKKSVCIIGNDSGPIHVASCTGNPVISISQFKTHTYSDLPDYWSEPMRHTPYCNNSCTISPKCINDIQTVPVSEVTSRLREFVNIGHRR